MSIATLAKTNGFYVGMFKILDNDKMSFETDIDRKKSIAIGDLVYFMYVDGRLMKIGKTGDASGFYGRAGLYKRGLSASCKTNERIIRIMKSIDKREIAVYAIATPRKPVEVVCPLTGKIDTVYLKTADIHEKNLTKTYLNEDSSNELPLCKQLN